MPRFLDLDAAEAKFGKLTSEGPRIHYLEFEEEGGVWKPVFHTAEVCLGYEFHYR